MDYIDRLVSPLAWAFEAILHDAIDENATDVLSAALIIRRSLCSQENPVAAIEAILENRQVLERLVIFLDRTKYEEALVIECSWALTNIASGSSFHCQALLEAGAIPPLVALLGSDSAHLQDQAIWTLGNLAGDPSGLRPALIDAGIIVPLIHLMENADDKGLLENVLWTFGNLFRNGSDHNHEEDLKLMKQCSLPLVRCLSHSDPAVKKGACWVVYYLILNGRAEREKKSNQFIHEKIDTLFKCVAGALQGAILNLVDSSSWITNQLCTVTTLLCLSFGTADQCRWFFHYPRMITKLRLLLNKSINKQSRIYACMIIGNLASTADNEDDLQVLLNVGTVPKLIKCLRRGVQTVKADAVYALSQLAGNASESQLIQMLEQGLIGGLCRALNVKCAEIRRLTLEVINVILDSIELSMIQMDLIRSALDSLLRDEILLDIVEHAHTLIILYYEQTEL